MRIGLHGKLATFRVDFPVRVYTVDVDLGLQPVIWGATPAKDIFTDEEKEQYHQMNGITLDRVGVRTEITTLGTIIPRIQQALGEIGMTMAGIGWVWSRDYTLHRIISRSNN